MYELGGWVEDRSNEHVRIAQLLKQILGLLSQGSQCPHLVSILSRKDHARIVIQILRNIKFRIWRHESLKAASISRR